MECGRRTSWNGGPRRQHASARVASRILAATPHVESPASMSTSYPHTNSKISLSSALVGLTFRPGFLPFLTGSGSQTEFDVTRSKQRAGKFLTGARTAIKLFKIRQLRAQELARRGVFTRRGGLAPINLRNRVRLAKVCAFLPGSAQKVACDVTYSKQSTGEFLPGATTASKAHSKSSNIDTKLSEERAWLRQ